MTAHQLTSFIGKWNGRREAPPLTDPPNAPRIRELMRDGKSTRDIARDFHCHEADIWNELCRADRKGTV
jgi:hypothetical protein